MPAALLRRRETMTIVKVLVSYMQIIDVFPRFSKVVWPSVFVAFLRALDLSKLIGISVWVGDLMLPFECALDIPIDFYARLLLTLLLPLLISSCIFFFAYLVWRLSGCDAEARRNLLASPAIFNLHLWVALILYPSLCRITLDTFQCVPYQASDNVTESLLYSDPSVKCYTPEWTGWAVVACFGVFIYCIGFPLAAWVLASQHHTSRSGRRQVHLLLSSYKPHYWFFEPIDLLRKLVLTSIVLLVDPNTKTQLWFGLVSSVAFCCLTIQLAPYRDTVPGLLQMAAQLQVVFNYSSAFLFFDQNPIFGTAPTNNSAGVLLIVINCTCFALLIIAMILAERTRREALGELKVTDASGRQIDLQPPAVTSGFHLFLSHQWQYGQDQVGTVKNTLQAILPTMRCFLDVDSLQDIAKLEAHIAESDVVLIMLTQGYMSSANCLRELRESVRLQKPMIVLRETDANHGAVSLLALKEEVELLPLQHNRDPCGGRAGQALRGGPRP